MERVHITLTDYGFKVYDDPNPNNENDMEIVSGHFTEGNYVTVRFNGKEYTRKVRYSARKWMDNYITINGLDYTYGEFAHLFD